MISIEVRLVQHVQARAHVTCINVRKYFLNLLKFLNIEIKLVALGLDQPRLSIANI